jgi:hypothetical protein
MRRMDKLDEILQQQNDIVAIKFTSKEMLETNLPHSSSWVLFDSSLLINLNRIQNFTKQRLPPDIHLRGLQVDQILSLFRRIPELGHCFFGIEEGGNPSSIFLLEAIPDYYNQPPKTDGLVPIESIDSSPLYLLGRLPPNAGTIIDVTTRQKMYEVLHFQGLN